MKSFKDPASGRFAKTGEALEFDRPAGSPRRGWKVRLEALSREQRAEWREELLRRPIPGTYHRRFEGKTTRRPWSEVRKEVAARHAELDHKELERAARKT